MPPDLSTKRINDVIEDNQESSAIFSKSEKEANNPLASKYEITPNSKLALSSEGGKSHLIIRENSKVTWHRLQNFCVQKGYEIVRKNRHLGLMDMNGETDHYLFRLRIERGYTSEYTRIFISGHDGNKNAQEDETILRQLAKFLMYLYEQNKQK